MMERRSRYNYIMKRNERKTDELHKVLESMALKDYEGYIENNDIPASRTLRSYFDEYMKEHGLTLPERAS